MKRDIDKAKRDRADEKRERRQRQADPDASAAVTPAAPAPNANDELLSRLQQVHAQFDAHEIDFEEFERTKDALLAQLATD